MWHWCPKPTLAQQQGNVLVATLLLLLALSLMGVGILYVAGSQISLTSSQENSTMGMATAETCVDEARALLQTQIATALPTTTQQIRNTMPSSGLSGASVGKLSPFVYSCTIEPLGQAGASATSGIGAEVGDSAVYGASGPGRTYYFRVTSTAQRNGVTVSTVEVLFSVTQ